MKNRLIFFAIVFCAVFPAQSFAQLWHDNATITDYTLRGHVYEYAKKSSSVRIYRKSTWPAQTYIMYSNGESPPPSGIGPKPYFEPAGFDTKMRQIYNTTFSATEKALAKGDMLIVIVYFDTNGKVIGVAYDFNTRANGWHRVPLEKLALFEENILAANFKFPVTAEGKRRNYLDTVWIVTP